MPVLSDDFYEDLNRATNPQDYNRILGKALAEIDAILSTSSGSMRAGLVNVGAGQKSQAISFSSPLPSANYQVVPTWSNVIDPDPQFQTLVVTTKTAAGFTVSWPADTDTANYKIEYLAQG